MRLPSVLSAGGVGVLHTLAVGSEGIGGNAFQVVITVHGNVHVNVGANNAVFVKEDFFCAFVQFQTFGVVCFLGCLIDEAVILLVDPVGNDGGRGALEQFQHTHGVVVVHGPSHSTYLVVAFVYVGIEGSPLIEFHLYVDAQSVGPNLLQVLSEGTVPLVGTADGHGDVQVRGAGDAQFLHTLLQQSLGIGVLFEKENINSLPPDSEFMITMYGAMAQSESESISGNIRRGKQMHAKVGTLKIPCYRLYGYEKDADGKFRVIPEQAEIVRELYKRYESGASLRNLQDWLEENQIKTVLGESKWTTTSIKSILTNEKYCGDVLLQKTFRTDVISKKVIKNVGQMAQYYMPDHHEAIVSREQYNAVKAEMARRSALRSPSKSAVTGRSCYTSKYALSDRLVCGECGTLYRRCTWTSLGRKYPVWRCTSRLNYGTKYCHDSPTIKEEPLQNAILAAINSVMSDKPALLDLIKNAVSLELLPVQGQTMSLADIERRLTQLDEQFQRLLAEAIDPEDKEACNAQFAEILVEQTALKKQKKTILQSSNDADRVSTRMKQAEQAVENAASTITEWNENAVRQIVERVTVLSTDEILVRIKGGAKIKQRLER